MKKSIVLLSGGLDSAVNLAIANQKTKILFALTFDYGQKSAKQEIKNSSLICKHYKIKHKVIKIDWLRELLPDALVGKTKLPALSFKDLSNLKKIKKTALAVWVPNRNGLFLNIAACFAEKLGADLIITGFNKEEAQTFPDNSLEFIKRANEFFQYSTLKKVKVKSYTQNLNKSKILEKAYKMKVPLEYIWSCYEGKKLMCGVCESCVRLKRAKKN